MAVWRDLDELKLWERNYNKGDVQQIKKSILRFGFNNALRVWRESTVMAGNHSTIALRECLADGWTATEDGIKLASGKLLRGGAVRVENGRVQVDTVDLAHLPKSEAEAFAIADNHIASKAEPDDLVLSDLLLELKEYDLEILEDIGFTDIEFSGLLDGIEKDDDKPDPGAQIDRADELLEVWRVERGQLWIIPSKSGKGDHRLLCGDSTNADDVNHVMGGVKADMVWTDPPYGVSIGDKNKMLNAIAPSNRVEENLTNDTLDEPELMEMLRKSFDCAVSICTAGASWYVAAPPGPLHVLFGQALKERGIWRQTIQWVKNNATFAPLGVDYHWRSEPIFYGWLPNAAHRYYGGRQQDTVWEIDRPTKSPEHPTMKPVELVARAVENSSLRGQVVCDLFGGSGTTMVASEQLGRLCCAIELEPKYVSVILQRMTDMGLEPYKAD